MVQFEEIIFIGYFFMAEYMIQSHYRAQKSKMAAKIQDGGQKFWMLLTKKLDMVLKNSHTKNGACCPSITMVNPLHPLLEAMVTRYRFCSQLVVIENKLS